MSEREQNVFLNNGEAQGEFDLYKLGQMYRDGIDFGNAGFDTADVYKMFGAPPTDEPSDALVDEIGDAIRESTKRLGDIVASEQKKNPTHFYLVVVFKDDDARVAFTDRLKLPDNRYVDGRRLADMLDPEPESQPAAEPPPSEVP